MSDSTPIRFQSHDLAKKIAAIHGGRIQTVKITMIGKEDVSKLLRKVKTARETAPSSTFRVK